MNNDVFSFRDFYEQTARENEDKEFVVIHPFVVKSFHISSSSSIIEGYWKAIFEAMDLSELIRELMVDLEYSELFSTLKEAETGKFEDNEMRKWAKSFKNMQ